MERPKKNPQRVRTRYSKEFKLEAVRLLKLGQKPPIDLALELGIRRNQLELRGQVLNPSSASSGVRS